MEQVKNYNNIPDCGLKTEIVTPETGVRNPKHSGEVQSVMIRSNLTLVTYLPSKIKLY